MDTSTCITLEQFAHSNACLVTSTALASSILTPDTENITNRMSANLILSDLLPE